MHTANSVAPHNKRLARLVFITIALISLTGLRADAQESAHPWLGWAAAGLGYATPGTANVLEGWVASGHFAFGIHASDADRGGFDSHIETQVYSALAGARVPLGPFRFIAAVGAGVANGPASNGQSGTHAVWQLSADLPLTTHIAWHAARFAVIGGNRVYVLDTIGLAIGNMR